MASILPPFGPEGALPEGIHVCSGSEFLDRFCKDNCNTRTFMSGGVVQVLDFAKHRHARYVFVGGSFVTNHPKPNDMDVLPVKKLRGYLYRAAKDGAKTTPAAGRPTPGIENLSAEELVERANDAVARKRV